MTVTGSPDATEPIFVIHDNEDDVTTVTKVGERHLVGNFIVMEFADSLEAATQFQDMNIIDREVIR